MEESTKENLHVKKVVTLEEMTGPLGFKMTNDYLFKALMQEEENTLRAFVAALLHVPMESVSDIIVQNPIVLGESIEKKTYMLDVLLTLDGYKMVNLEMQTAVQDFWSDRALVYTARLLDDLDKGSSYLDVKTVHHIGILDFNLFEEEKEFFSTYRMRNIKTGYIFSSKFSLSVLNLKQIENATKEDIVSGLHLWGQLFLAKTWEELRMLAEENEVMHETVVRIHELTANERIRMQMQAQEEAARIELTYKKKIREQGEKLQEQDETIRRLMEEMERMKALLEEKR